MNRIVIRDISIVLLPWLWLGLIVGISFIATPVKFQAQNLELGVALDIGRHTFNLFNSIEWVLLAGMFLLCLVKPILKMQLQAVVILGLILITQTYWLLPELIARADAVIAGNPKPKSSHHDIYAVLEVLKFLILLFVSLKMIVSMRLGNR